MREVKTIGHYMGAGSRAQVHAAIVGEERVALKIVCACSPVDITLCTKCMVIQYRDRAFFEQEKEAYEHLLRGKPFLSLKLPRYFGTFGLAESVLSAFEFQPSRIDKRQHVGPCTPYKVALGFEEFSGVGLHTIINDLNDMCLAKLEKDLFKTIQALHEIGICHRDLKADNILLNPSMLEHNQQVTIEYMVIDFSDAALRHETSVHRWRKLQKLDFKYMREIFLEARAAKVRVNKILSLVVVCTFG
jgi:serine/threonine protein kinase